MVTADQLVLHAIGDYVLQSQWMATRKTTEHGAAFAHALLYSLPFILLGPSLPAWAVLFGTHFLIDRYRLARYVVWLKNWIDPEGYYPFRETSATGYHPVFVQPWMAVWLMIIADNILHVSINALCLRYL